jgi:hypothetical protein
VAAARATSSTTRPRGTAPDRRLAAAKEFTWARTAREMHTLLEEVLRAL